jgi:hypothetical protein
VPVLPWLQGLCAAYLLLALAVNLNADVQRVFGTFLWRLQERGVPTLFTMFDKTYVSAVRLLHILALAYLLSSFQVVKHIAASPIAKPFVLLGRNSLAVFAAGSMLAIACQVIKISQPPSDLLDTCLIFVGLGLQIGLAVALEKGRLKPIPSQKASPLPQSPAKGDTPATSSLV